MSQLGTRLPSSLSSGLSLVAVAPASTQRRARRCVCWALVAAALLFLAVLAVLWTPAMGLGVG